MKKNLCAALAFALLASCLAAAFPISAGAANSSDVLALLPETFTFASGAGGWQTDVHINADGTFTGFFEDWDMGGGGDGYPNGTVFQCFFSGAFTNIVKISDYEYSMRIAALHTQGTEGEERIVDGVKIVTGSAYGFDHADEFRIYLPGMQTSDLPDGYISWVYWPLTLGAYDGSISPVMPFYGLYNVGGQQGFYSDIVTDAVPTESSSHIVGTVTIARPDSVSMRNRASEDANRIVRISAGAACLCVGQDASGWYKVYYNGYIGYIPESAAVFSTQGARAGHSLQILGVVTVTSNDFVNIRSAPDQNSEWLAGVSPGISLDYIGVAENGWYCVVLPSGQFGYVSNKLCSIR